MKRDMRDRLIASAENIAAEFLKFVAISILLIAFILTYFFILSRLLIQVRWIHSLYNRVESNGKSFRYFLDLYLPGLLTGMLLNVFGRKMRISSTVVLLLLSGGTIAAFSTHPAMAGILVQYNPARNSGGAISGFIWSVIAVAAGWLFMLEPLQSDALRRRNKRKRKDGAISEKRRDV